MSTAWSEFFPSIVPDLPGAPLPLVEHHVREAVREFCEQTLYWREILTIDLEAATHTYPLIPAGIGDPPVIPYIVHRINRVEIANLEDPLDESNEAVLDATDIRWRTKLGQPFAYLQPTSAFVRIVYTPEADLTDGLIVTAAVKPLANAPELFNDDILEHHREDIASGVKGRLMLSPKKPYTDAAMGKMHADKFNAACGSAATRRARDFTKRPMRVRGYDR